MTIHVDLFGERTFDEKAFEKELMDFYLPRYEAHDFQFCSVALKDPNSKWKVSSALQKCIRRGIYSQAGRYAQALIHGGQGDYFWGRLPTIALEDVGPANMELCAFVLMCCRFKAIRSKMEEDRLADFLVTEMARGIKSRAYCDVAVAWMFDPECKIPSNSPNYDAVRTVAYLHAKELGVTDPVSEDKDVPGYLKKVNSSTLPAPHWYTLVSATKKSVYGLHSSILPVWGLDKVETHSEVSECTSDLGELVGGVPLFTFDQHVLEGKKALSYLVKSLELESKMPYLANTGALSMLMFQMESALLNRRLSTPELDNLKACNDRLELIHAGIPSSHHDACREFLASEPVQAEITRVRKRIVLGK